MNLTDNRDEAEVMIKAELHRNLRQFDECLRYISKINGEYTEKRAKQIKAAALSGHNSVIRFD